MIRILISIAAIATLASGADAQEFKGDCKPFATSATCQAIGWCRWTDRKAVTLPNGQQFQPKGFCAFKPGHKAGWQATQQAAAAPKQ